MPSGQGDGLGIRQPVQDQAHRRAGIAGPGGNLVHGHAGLARLEQQQGDVARDTAVLHPDAVIQPAQVAKQRDRCSAAGWNCRHVTHGPVIA